MTSGVSDLPITKTSQSPSSGLSAGTIGAIVGTLGGVIIIIVITVGFVACYRMKLLVEERTTHLDLNRPSGRLEKVSETEQVGTEHVEALELPVGPDNSEMTPSGMLRYPDAEITDSGRITTWE
jgi:hypothetical protein